MTTHLPLTTSLRFFSTPRHGNGRVSLITDHAPSAHLPEPFKRGLNQVALLARQRHQRLRIISRQQPIAPQHLVSSTSEAAFHLVQDLEICHLPTSHTAAQIDLFPDELIFTDSWSSTASIVSTVGQDNFYYLLQEDERLLCTNAEDRAHCIRIWSDLRIRLLVSDIVLLKLLQAQGLCMHAQLLDKVMPLLAATGALTAAS